MKIDWPIFVIGCVLATLLLIPLSLLPAAFSANPASPTTHVIMVPADCDTVVSAVKNRSGLFITYTSRKGYERMAQYEYRGGAWKIIHIYLFARKK